MGYDFVKSIDFQGGIDVSAPNLSPKSQAMLSDGSWNAIVSGSGHTRPFSGATSQGVDTGAAKLVPYSNTWGGIRSISYSDKAASAIGTNTFTVALHGYPTGLSCQLTTTVALPTGLDTAMTYYIIRIDANTISLATSLANALNGTVITFDATGASGTQTVDVTASTVTASGSFFQDVGRSRWGIGSGVPMVEGTPIPGFTLSTNLQVQILASGAYGTPNTAGLAQPSAPEVGIVPDSIGDVSNSVSAKISRTRPSTGAESLASPVSAVITPQANKIRVTFPVAATGQTHWRVYLSFQGFGGTGIHYLATYTALQDIPESTVSGGTVDGVARSLEFNYKDGDLLPIESSFDNYTPPAATHAVRIQNVMALVGCYADSVTGPTSTSPGTAIAISKENNYEAYVPTSLLFLPEPVVDVLARPKDDYAYVACQNSIHAIQYVGERGDGLPSCTLTTILPDTGIEYHHNWCHFRGNLLIYAGQGNLMILDESGQVDTDFAGPVAKILKGFETSTTTVGYDPKNDSIIVFNATAATRALIFSLQTRQWRQVFLPDFGYTGIISSCVTAKRDLYFSLRIPSPTENRAYTWDTGSVTAPLSFCSNYQSAPPGKVIDIYEMAVAAETNVAAGDLAIVIARNLGQAVFRRVAATSGSPILTDSDAQFYASLLGKRAILFGTDVDGSGTYWKRSTVTNVASAPSQITLADNIGASVSNCLLFVGDYTAVESFATSHMPNFFPNLTEMRSFQAAIWFRSSGDAGNVFSLDMLGTSYLSSRAGL